MRMWRVVDVMSVDVAAVREETPYREIVDTLTARRVSALPVVDELRRVVGLVSEADLLHKVEFADGTGERRVFRSRRRRQAEAKANGGVARDLMSTPAMSVVPGTSLTAAAKLMEDEKVKRLPVVDELGRLVGIVARSDLLRVYLRPDSEINRDVTIDVLQHTLWVEPGIVDVQVVDGVVTLSGRTDRRSTALLAVKLTRAVPGVVEVEDRLGYEYDDRDLAEAWHYGPNPFGMP